LEKEIYIFAGIGNENNQISVNNLRKHLRNLESTGYVKNVLTIDDSKVLIGYETESKYGLVEKFSTGKIDILSGYATTENGLKVGEFSQLEIEKGKITAHSDFTGSCPKFYGTNGNEVAVSNDAHSIAIFLGLQELSKESAVELVKYGHCISRRTTIESVFRIWPEEKLIVQKVNEKIIIRIEKNHDLDYKNSKPVGGVIETAFQNLMSDTQKIPLDFSSAVCQLSGGLDSRLTAGVVSRTKMQHIKTLNISFSEISESKIAGEVAEKLASEHRTITIDSSDIALVRKSWLLTSGQVGVNAAAGNLVGYNYCTENGADIIIGGWQGDCLIGSYVPKQTIYIKPGYRKFAIRNWAANRGYPDKEILELFPQRISKLDLRKAKKRLFLEVKSIKCKDAAQQVSWWGMFRRQPTFSNISPARLCSDVIEVTPLLGKNYIGELLKLTGIDLLNKNFYRKLIYTQFPEYRKINYSLTNAPITETYNINANKLSVKKVIFTIFPSALLEEIYTRMRAKFGEKKVIAVSPLESIHWYQILNTELLRLGEPYKSQQVFNEERNLNNLVQYLGVLVAVEWTREYLLEFEKPCSGVVQRNV